MRINVTTAISVLSNTVPSTPAPKNDAVPEDWCDFKSIGKPSTDMPSLVPRLDAVPARMKASQRPRQHSRLSAFLHGFSVVGEESNTPPARPRKMYRYSTRCYARTPRTVRSEHHQIALRPATSTRGVIDPVHSPTSATWPLTHHIQTTGAGTDLANVAVEMTIKPSKHRPYAKSKIGGKMRSERDAFFRTTNPNIRKKVVGCLFFGTLLTIVLTTYLALATSNGLRGATFHGVFIFFILILTIVFSHYLIRLCMLSFRPQRRLGKPTGRTVWPYNEEAAQVARPPTPIPVTFARDEELGQPDGSLHEGDTDLLEEKVLPAPPPVYGNWRSSVRADPNLIHWHPASASASTVQQEARELILAGSGHRPPSYTSEHQEDGVEVVGQWQPATGPPLPLFTERRRAATVDYMREVTGR